MAYHYSIILKHSNTKYHESGQKNSYQNNQIKFYSIISDFINNNSSGFFSPRWCQLVKIFFTWRQINGNGTLELDPDINMSGNRVTIGTAYFKKTLNISINQKNISKLYFMEALSRKFQFLLALMLIVMSFFFMSCMIRGGGYGYNHRDYHQGEDHHGDDHHGDEHHDGGDRH